MRILAVFESMFGATEQIARAVGKGLTAEVVNVDDAPADLTGVDLLVAGGPTHAHGMSRATTRKSAADQGDQPNRAKSGVREWLGSLGPVPQGLPVAAFDTRLDKSRLLTGAASLGIAKLLRRRGCRMAAPAESFFVGTDPADVGLAPVSGSAPRPGVRRAVRKRAGPAPEAGRLDAW